VIVVVESLHPAIPSLYWEATRYTLRGKQLIPVFFAVGKAVLQVEWGVGKYFPTVGTDEALRMEVGAHGFQAVPDNLPPTLATLRSQVPPVTILAVESPLLLNKAHFLQRLPAALHVAGEAGRAPGPAEGRDEGAPYLGVTAPAHWSPHARLLLL